MGNASNKKEQKEKQAKESQLSQVNSAKDQQYQWDQFVEMEQCCFVTYQRIKKRKLNWEINFLKNLKELKQNEPRYSQWCQILQNLIKNSKYPRNRFYVEINTLRYQLAKPKIQENEFLLSPCQVEQFKVNLKRSVLIHYKSAKKSLSLHNSSMRSSGSKQPMISKNKMIRPFRNTYLSQNMKNFKQNSNRQSSDRSMLRQSILSFFDDTLASLLKNNDKQISKQASYSLELFIKFTVILENHLNNQTCALFNIKQQFINFLIDKYTKISSKNLIKQQGQNYGQILQQMVDNINIFLIILKETVYDYYSLKTFADQDNNYNLITNDENLSGMITAIVFKDQRLYRTLFNSVKNYNQQREAEFLRIISKVQFPEPQYFQIKPQYCLNNRNIPKAQSENILTQLIGQDKQSVSSITQSDIPYDSCIRILQNLPRAHSPIAKMKIILQCAQNITECVKNFYIKNGLESKHWVLDADQILSIFCYLIVKANVSNLHSHMYILQHFSTDHQLISVTGYYYSVLMCAIEQIEHGIDKSLDNHINDSR